MKLDEEGRRNRGRGSKKKKRRRRKKRALWDAFVVLYNIPKFLFIFQHFYHWMIQVLEYIPSALKYNR